jgi:hypothetical protein
MIPHKCPVCDGTGKVSRPPHVAGDVPSWSDSSGGPYNCRACKGTCLVWEAETVSIPTPFEIKLTDEYTPEPLRSVTITYTCPHGHEYAACLWCKDTTFAPAPSRWGEYTA